MSIFSLPDQTIAESKKGKEWHRNHGVQFVAYTGSSTNYSNQKALMLKYYRGYLAQLSKKEEEAVQRITCPYGVNLGQDYIVYPLIQMKIEQLVGEFIQRPLRRKTYATNKKAKNDKLDKKAKMLAEDIMRGIAKDMEGDLGFEPQTENPDIQLPEGVEELQEMEVKTIAEEIGDDLLSYFLDVRKEKQKFKEVFIDYCIVDRGHIILDKKHGHHTTMRKVHPLDCEYDLDPYVVTQKDHGYFYETYMYTLNEIFNNYPKITKKEKESIKALFNSTGGTADGDTYDTESLGRKLDVAEGWIETKNNVMRLRGIKLIWKSRKRIKVKVSKNKKTGEDVYRKLPEDYKPRENDKIEYLDVEIPRYVTMIGPEIVLDYGVMEERYSYMDDPKSCQLPVISIVRENTIGTSSIKSVAAKLYQLQEMASEILFEIRLAMKRSGGRVLVYDVAQTPKEFSGPGFKNGVDRVMHHAKKDQFMLINSAQKGKTNGAGFNQFTSLDLSNKGHIQDLFGGLSMIEDLADRFIGLSPERQGQVGQYQTATGVDSAVRGSTARTEVLFTPFDEFVVDVLEKVLMKTKKDYPKGEVIQFIMGNMKTKFLKIFEEYYDSDLGIYIADARKDLERSRKIDEAVGLALGNAQTPEMIMGLIDVFEGDTASEKKAVFARILNSLEKVKQENQKAAQADQENANQVAQAQIEKEDEQKDKILQNNLDVAHVYADNKMNDRLAQVDSAERIKAAELSSAESQKNKE